MLNNFQEALILAIGYIFNPREWFIEIILLSIIVNFLAALISSIISFPLAGYLSQLKTKTKYIVLIIAQTCLALPPVVLGLIIYLLLSKSTGSRGSSLLFTPYIILIAQTIIVIPIALSLSYRIFVEKLDIFYQHFKLIGLSKFQIILTIIFEARKALLIVFTVCLGRAMAEVSSILILGGNIEGYTRFMTSSIVLETAKGDLSKALAFGICLLLISLIINLFVNFALVKK